MENKKRLMYIGDEDFNYLTYIVLLVLDTYKCHNESKTFKDYRKIAIIIVLLVKGDFDIENLSFDDEFQNNFFNTQYYHIKKFIPQLRKILIALELKKIIKLHKTKGNIMEVYISDKEKVKEILIDEAFIEDSVLLLKLKEIYPRVKSIKYNSMLKKFAGENEVTKWEL